MRMGLVGLTQTLRLVGWAALAVGAVAGAIEAIAGMSLEKCRRPYMELACAHDMPDPHYWMAAMLLAAGIGVALSAIWMAAVLELLNSVRESVAGAGRLLSPVSKTREDAER